MSSVPDHLYEDGNTTGYRRKQTKSILKNKENMTMPNPSMPLRHFDTASRLANRRVSFANKVKLHKIDFVPANGEDVPEEDSSEEEGNVSLSALEKDTSGFVDLMRNMTESHSSDDEDLPQNENATRSTEDQTMDFTGLIRQTQEQDMEFTSQLDGKLNLAYPLSTDQHHLGFDYENLNMELTMQFTKNISSYTVVSSNQESLRSDSPKPHFLNGHKLQFDHNGNEEATMDFTKFFEDNTRNEGFNFPEAARYSPVPNADYGVSIPDRDGDDMELTQPFNKPTTSNIQEKWQRDEPLTNEANTPPPILTSPSLSADEQEGPNGKPENEETMELTNQVTVAALTSFNGMTEKTQTQEAEIAKPKQTSEAALEESVQDDLPEGPLNDPTKQKSQEIEKNSSNETTDKTPSVYGTPAASPVKQAAQQDAGDGEISNPHEPSEEPKDGVEQEGDERSGENEETMAQSSPRKRGGKEEEELPSEAPKQDNQTDPEQSRGQDSNLAQNGLEQSPQVTTEEPPEQTTVAKSGQELTDITRPSLTPEGPRETHLPEKDSSQESQKEHEVFENVTKFNRIELSQPMELTQPRSAIEAVSEIELQLKRVSEDFEELQQKQQRREPHVSTLDIPLAETSTLSIDGVDDDFDDPNYQPVSLTTFLNDIGVKFYDDLEIASDTANRYSLSLQDELLNITDEDYYKGNVHLPLLEVLELSCKELTQKIQQGKALFKEVSDQTLSDNPMLFKQYYLSSYYDQISMKSHFHLLKEFTRYQAKQVWYQWRTQLMQNLLEVQQGNLEQLEADKLTLQGSIKELEQVHEDIKLDLQLLKNDVSSFKEIKASFKDLDANQLKVIRLQLMDLNKKLLEHRGQIGEKEEHLAEVRSEIEKANAHIQKQRDDLRKAESQLSRRRNFSSQEINVLEHEVRATEKRAGISYISGIGSNEIEFECNASIGVVVTYLEATPTNIRFFQKLSETSDLMFADLAPLAILALPRQDLTAGENLKEFQRVWEKFKQVDSDLYKLSLKHPFKLEVTKNALKFYSTIFNFESGAETIYSLELKANDIMYYPDQLTVSAKPGRRLRTTTSAIPSLHGISDKLMNKFKTPVYD